VIEKPIAVNG
jgi:pyruvate/2-oxoglutarate dehydrogenase complex dihydrolipoamide acyltransferase (E2) component